jgi:hypothetical protein
VRKIFTSLFVLVWLNLFASDAPALRQNKQDIIEQEKKEIEANSEKIKYDWISPIKLSSTYSKSDNDIEVFLKTTQYETGSLDVTELNRALRDKNAIRKTELNAKQTIVEQEIELKKLTDIEFEAIEPPKGELQSFSRGVERPRVRARVQRHKIKLSSDNKRAWKLWIFGQSQHTLR